MASTAVEMYALISIPGVDPLSATYDDQRFIQSYGPIHSLAPGQTFNIVTAVAIGEGLEGLQASSDWAQNPVMTMTMLHRRRRRPRTIAAYPLRWTGDARMGSRRGLGSGRSQ